MKKYIIMVTLIIVVLSINNLVYAVNIPENIRVGLYYGSTAKQTISMTSTNNMLIGTLKDNSFSVNEELSEKLVKGVTLKFTVDQDSDNYIRIYIDDILVGGSDSPIGVQANNAKLKLDNNKNYRGIMEISRIAGGNLKIINQLSLQEYLYLVVPSEIESSSHIEALKAQAVAARTYTLTGMNRHSADGFNVCSTTHCQVYGGTVEAISTNKAVDETKDVVMTYDGKLVEAYYFSTSGGYTEDVLNVWTADLPYLKAVEDPYEAKTKPWVVTYTKQELEDILTKQGVNIGEVTNLKATEYTAAGRANKILFVGTNGTKEYAKEYARTLFNLRSRMYIIEGGNSQTTTSNIKIVDKDGNITTKDVNTNNLQTVDGKSINSDTKIMTVDGEKNIEKETQTQGTDTYVFTGYGYGHGVGMSQNGAKGMANAGFAYEDILKHYYTGITIQK